jgi:hypothetical protein
MTRLSLWYGYCWLHSCLNLDNVMQSERVLESLYGMQWLHAPLPFKRSLVLAMERAKRPLRPAAGRVIPLSLNTFVTVRNTIYNFKY